MLLAIPSPSHRLDAVPALATTLAGILPRSMPMGPTMVRSVARGALHASLRCRSTARPNSDVAYLLPVRRRAPLQQGCWHVARTPGGRIG